MKRQAGFRKDLFVFLFLHHLRPLHYDQSDVLMYWKILKTNMRLSVREKQIEITLFSLLLEPKNLACKF